MPNFIVMKKLSGLIAIILLVITYAACNSNTTSSTNTTTDDQTQNTGGQEAVQDDESQKDIVKVAVGSKDHSILVAALKQAEYVNDLSNAGPFTVFAPTNAAFDKLPAGTVDNLMKDENKKDLQNILEYHVSIGVFKENMLRDGQTIGQANGDNITINKSADGKMKVNGSANIVAAIPASNGLIYVIDEVLLPPAKK